MVAPATLCLRPSAGLSPARYSFPSMPLFHLPPRSLQLPLPLTTTGHRPLLRSLSVAAAVSVDANQSVSPTTVDQEKPKKKRYHFLVANAKFMLDEEEHFQEQLFERLRNYEERSKERDFWLVVEPKFLDKFPGITKRLKRPAVALVSTDATWITFMKLRLDRVLQENFEADSLEEALASNPVDLQFEKPEKWVAPYPKYESGWWKPFLLPEASKTTT